MGDSQSSTAAAVPLNYSGQPADSRIVAEELDDRFRLTILPSGTWRELRELMLCWLLGLLPAIPTLLAWQKLRSAFPELPIPWQPLLWLIPTFLFYLCIAWVVGSITITIELMGDRVAVQSASRLWKRSRTFERDSIGSIAVGRIVAEIRILDKNGRLLRRVNNLRRADRRWLATVLRFWLDLRDQA